MSFLDAWEEELTGFIKGYYQDFLLKQNFKFVKKEVAADGTGKFVYTDSNLVIKIGVKEKKYTLELGQVDDRKFWSLSLILANFKFIDYKITENDTDARRNVLLQPDNTDNYSGVVNTLTQNLKRIREEFAEDNFDKVKEQLINLEMEKQSFGN